MKTELLEEVVFDQMENLKSKNSGTIRNVDFRRLTQSKQIVVISGIRRCGKSTLLLQFMKNFDNYYYLNFDDERLLNFEVTDFRELMLIFKKQFHSKVMFFDEIQNIKGWEHFVRRTFDEGNKIFITGSNANLLSSELATHLTGRYFKVELFPFSFKEILTHKTINPAVNTTKNKAEILKTFDYYLDSGGFPEFLNYGDTEFLKRVYDDIIYKGLIVRYGIRNVKTFRNLSRYLFTNFTGELSYNSLKTILNIKSTNTVKEYVGYLEDSYLLFELYKFDYSLKKQYVSNKKIYVSDNGLRNKISFIFSKDTGKLMENLIYLELRRKYEELYFYKTVTNKEIDFLFSTDKGFHLIQVSYSLNDIKTKQREINAIVEANKSLSNCTNYLITYNEEDLIKIGNIEINIIPAWKWLLQ